MPTPGIHAATCALALVLVLAGCVFTEPGHPMREVEEISLDGLPAFYDSTFYVRRAYGGSDIGQGADTLFSWLRSQGVILKEAWFQPTDSCHYQGKRVALQPILIIRIDRDKGPEPPGFDPMAEPPSFGACETGLVLRHYRFSGDRGEPP